MYWFYEQILQIGRTGSPEENLSVFAATRRQMAMAQRLAAERKK
jgi:hypothetical protein